VLLARLYYKLKRPEDANRERAIVERLNAEQQERQAREERDTPMTGNPEGRSPAPPKP
jgi:hypothetical protein